MTRIEMGSQDIYFEERRTANFVNMLLRKQLLIAFFPLLILQFLSEVVENACLRKL